MIVSCKPTEIKNPAGLSGKSDNQKFTTILQSLIFRRMITINKMRRSFQPPVTEFKNAVDLLCNAADRINSHQHIAYVNIKNYHKL